MNQGYNLRFDQMKENIPVESDSKFQGDESDKYQSTGNIRNFALIWKNGKMQGFLYAYVSDFSFEIENEKNVITIEVSSKVIKLYGYGLTTLFWEFFDQIPRIIREVDERYATEKDCVVKIVVENN